MFLDNQAVLEGLLWLAGGALSLLVPIMAVKWSMPSDNGEFRNILH